MSRRDITLADVGLAGEASGNKYRNRKTLLDGIWFDSAWEATVYAQLLLREQAGEISDLKLQTVWVLQDAFRDRDGMHHRAITYRDDFDFLEQDIAERVVIDAKGTETEVYKIKRKLFLFRYPHVVFRQMKQRGNR